MVLDTMGTTGVEVSCPKMTLKATMSGSVQKNSQFLRILPLYVFDTDVELFRTLMIDVSGKAACWFILCLFEVSDRYLDPPGMLHGP